MSDYAFPERRKNRNDKRAKSRFNRFKQGGQFRSSNVQIGTKDNNQKEKR
jgi:hypothetical protein